MKSSVSDRWFLFFVGTLLGASALRSADQPLPLIHAHAHNDYLHARPLLDALDHGFCSVEADVWLVNGQLLVAHDRDKVKPGRTLQALYLDSLYERAKRNDGRIYPGGPPVTLLIDVKSDAESTYAALRDTLRQYADMLTTFRTNTTETKAVTIILSGNRALNTLASEELRYAALDGRLSDLAGDSSQHLSPLISDKWSTTFRWRGIGPVPEDEKQKLRGLVARAHAQGRRVRFWSAPDSPPAWRELLAAGVDLINTDNLDGLEKFLRKSP